MKKILFITAVLIGIFFSSISVSAKEIYSSYSYGNDKDAETAPEAAVFAKTVNFSDFGVGLGSVTDLYFDKADGILYAVDQRRILILSSQ